MYSCPSLGHSSVGWSSVPYGLMMVPVFQQAYAKILIPCLVHCSVKGRFKSKTASEFPFPFVLWRGLGESTPICSFFWQQVNNEAQVKVYLDGPTSRNIHADGPQKESWHIKLNGLRFVCLSPSGRGLMHFPEKKKHIHKNVCCSLLFWYLNCAFVLFLF